MVIKRVAPQHVSDSLTELEQQFQCRCPGPELEQQPDEHEQQCVFPGRLSTLPHSTMSAQWSQQGCAIPRYAKSSSRFILVGQIRRPGAQI